jgi:hypothetical protein
MPLPLSLPSGLPLPLPLPLSQRYSRAMSLSGPEPPGMSCCHPAGGIYDEFGAVQVSPVVGLYHGMVF